MYTLRIYLCICMLHMMSFSQTSASVKHHHNKKKKLLPGEMWIERERRETDYWRILYSNQHPYGADGGWERERKKERRVKQQLGKTKGIWMLRDHRDRPRIGNLKGSTKHHLQLLLLLLAAVTIWACVYWKRERERDRMLLLEMGRREKKE